MKLRLIIFLFSLLLSTSVEAATRYVRVDGGTPTGVSGTIVCNGTVDAPATVGNSPNCAYNHYNWAIPAMGQPTTYKISTSDTLIIGPGSYRERLAVLQLHMIVQIILFQVVLLLIILKFMDVVIQDAEQVRSLSCGLLVVEIHQGLI